MSTGFVIINDKPLREFLGHLRTPAKRERVLKAIGATGVKMVKSHLVAKDAAEPNQLGGKREHYYKKAGDSTHFDLTRGGVVITVSHVGINLRYHGGVVRPKNAKALAIPTSPLSKGTYARDFERSTGLEMFPLAKKYTGGTTGVLAVAFDERIEAVYVLRSKTTHKPDPTVLPKRDALIRSATRAAQLVALRAAKGGLN